MSIRILWRCLLWLMKGDAAINRATREGCVRSVPISSEPLPGVAVLPVKEWVRRKVLYAMNENEHPGRNGRAVREPLINRLGGLTSSLQ